MPGGLTPSGRQPDPGAGGGDGPSVAATQPWGLDSLSDGDDDFDDDMQDIAGDARESVKQAVGRHNDAILNAIVCYGEALVTIMLGRAQLWANGNGEGQRRIAETDGNELVYINDFLVTEHQVGLGEFPSSGKVADWPESIKESIMEAAHGQYAGFFRGSKRVQLGSKTSTESRGRANLNETNL